MPDPRLKKIARDQLPLDLQTLWDNVMRDRDEATLIEAAGNAPEVLDWYYISFYVQMWVWRSSCLSLIWYRGKTTAPFLYLTKMQPNRTRP